MRVPEALAFALVASVLACHDDDTVGGGPCAGTCGIEDHKYFSEFYCPPGPLRPGGWVGYSWRDLDACLKECDAAAGWGCQTGDCAAGCTTDHGTGAWLSCTSAGGVERDDGCFLSGSGVRGETVPCICR
jgi:hypothetical protein